MSPGTTRALLRLHRWAGLILSLNVILFSATGLLLIFHEEIDALLEQEAPKQAASPVTLREAVAIAQRKLPNSHAVYVSRDSEHPDELYVGLSQTSRKIEDSKAFRVDARTGRLNEQDFESSFSVVVFRLHAQLLAGPIGSLVVGALGLALLLLLVTGAVIYGPMMKRFAYGTLRRTKHRRNFWADFHKLVGVSTFGWLVLVVATGILLSLGSVLLQFYAQNELRTLARVDATQQVVDGLPTVDEAVATAERGAPGRRWSITIFPGADLASPQHFSVLLRGTSGLEERMLSIALVDAAAPSKARFHELPLYLRALLISQPLHFGDYGGLPLRLLWALFTIGLIGLAGTGVYTFFAGRTGSAKEALALPLSEPKSSEAAAE